ncbi:hypothetical protein [Macrococcus armenti]|uniref:Uncharacterized protein n=1 Tax=Macrococcus armenti TaxID=2875764 RepID=A0ABY3ZU33_9STAP|nr:hypothetical protein [Macrococcus armenti]UOB20338.1 hypothetical protein MRZ06_10175 [Macrococcus armenti]
MTLNDGNIILNELFLQMFVGPNNAIAASFIIMMATGVVMIIDKYKSDEE